MTPYSVSPPDVVVGITDNIGIVSLNRPDRMNSFTNSARNAIIASLKALDGDSEINAIMIRGADATSFSSGQNLDEAYAVTLGEIAPWQEHQRAMYQTIRDLEKPCVAAVDGICVGGGMHVALCTDWRVATPASQWGQPEVKVGVASIVGPYLMGLHVGWTHNIQLSLSGELISGRRAYEIGLVTQLADSSDLHEVALERAKRLGALPKFAVRLTKKRLRDVTQADFDDVYIAGIRAQTECYELGEAQALMAHFIERRNSKPRRE